jgi:predicted DNA-binding transcriptional regulator AlpA
MRRVWFFYDSSGQREGWSIMLIHGKLDSPGKKARVTKKPANKISAKAKALTHRVPVRLLSKPEVMAIAGVTFPTIWTWMQDGKFPRSREAGGKSMWLSTEIDAWLAGLPVRPLKGDPPPS